MYKRQGEEFTFDEMTQGLYDVICPETEYAKFKEVSEELDQALPGSDLFNDRLVKFKERILVKPEHLLKVIKSTTKAWHDIAVEKMDVTGNSMPRIRVGELPTPDMVFISILFGYDYNPVSYTHLDVYKRQPLRR